MRCLLIFAVLIVHNTYGVLLTSVDQSLFMKLRSGRILQTDNDNSNLHDVSTPLTNSVTTNVDVNCKSPSHSSLPHSVLDPNKSSPIEQRGCCITCRKHLDTNHIYTNKLTGEEFRVTEKLNCKSTGIIYLIRCAHPNCSMQYIGQTINSLNTRCVGHRLGILSKRYRM